MLETFLSRSYTCVVPNGELGFTRHEMANISGLPVVGDLYEEYVPTIDDIKGESEDFRLLYTDLLYDMNIPCYQITSDMLHPLHGLTNLGLIKQGLDASN